MEKVRLPFYDFANLKKLQIKIEKDIAKKSI